MVDIDISLISFLTLNCLEATPLISPANSSGKKVIALEILFIQIFLEILDYLWYFVVSSIFMLEYNNCGVYHLFSCEINVLSSSI